MQVGDFDRDREYDRVDSMLEDLYELIDGYKPGVFGGKGFDKEEALDIIQSIRAELPSVIKQAQKFVDNSERIISDASNQANRIIREAENDATLLVSEHEITRRAKEEAEAMMLEMNQYEREMCLGVNQYAEECLEKTAEAIQESIDEFVRNMKLTETALNDEIKVLYENKQMILDNYEAYNNSEKPEKPNIYN